jgi:hypothetical protein
MVYSKSIWQNMLGDTVRDLDGKSLEFGEAETPASVSTAEDRAGKQRPSARHHSAFSTKSAFWEAYLIDLRLLYPLRRRTFTILDRLC